MLVVLAAVFSRKSFKEWAPLAIGTTLGFIVMVGGPLTGGSFNPARWFGPALVGNDWGDFWPYLVGPIVGSLLAAAVFRFVLEPGGRRRPSRPSASSRQRRNPRGLKPMPWPTPHMRIDREPPGLRGPGGSVS